MAGLSTIRSAGGKLTTAADNYATRASSEVSEQIGKRSVQGVAIGGGSVVGYKGLEAYETQQEAGATQSYMEARQAILNDESLSPAERQRELEKLRNDYQNNGETGASTWFDDMSLSQVAMFIGMGWLGVKLVSSLSGRVL